MKPVDVSPGTKPAARDRPEIVKRMLSAMVLAALALAAAMASTWTFAALIAAAGVVVAWEWGRLVRGDGVDSIAVTQSVAVAAVAVFAALSQPELVLLAIAAGLAAIALFGLNSGSLGWSLIGLLAAALPAWSLIWLRSGIEYGAVALLFVFAVAWTTDTASYAGGRLIGGPKLAPAISPQKTWSGLLLGILAPALIGVVFALALEGTAALQLALLGMLLGAACQAGDLTESAVKRRFGAKDMSGLIPGHGGLLDRVDGLLMAAVVAALIALRDPASPGRGLLMW